MGVYYGDEVHSCVAHRGRSCRRSKGVSIAYGPSDATATHSLASVKSRLVLVPAHPGNPGQSPESCKTDVTVG